MTTLRAGQFVRSMQNDLGIGKVAAVEGDRVTVEYFDSPTDGERPTRSLPSSMVEATELHQETRVYFKHPATQAWFVGRALLKTGDAYRVQFPNRKVGELPESSLFVRWDRPIDDPTDHLANRVNETPYFHEGRAPFRASLVEQRAGCAGMTGLFSSVIELEEHQIEVVRRVLEDPVQRYLLADEVGLGKTIEAGAIMRQYALDRPRDYGILVVVPPHLCEQWEEELAQRFLFDQELGERVHVVPFEATGEILALGMQVGMVVVDEAHQIAQYAHSEDDEERGIYESIQSVTEVTDKLLLLSATPVLHNEAGYLAMLHLLDPQLYALDDVDGFRKTVRDRQQTAELFHRFAPDADASQLQEAARELIEQFEDDERLESLAGDLMEHLDDDEEREKNVEALRTHISETYRLHRRVLRTQHTEETQWLLPGRAPVQTVEFDEGASEAIDEALDNWRQGAAEVVDDGDGNAEAYTALFRRFFEARCGLFDTFARTVDERRAAIADGATAEPVSFDGEEELLDGLSSALNEARDAGNRMQRLVEYLASVTEDGKAVVFVTEEEDADRVFEHLETHLDVNVVRHEVARHLREAEWKVFFDEEHGAVLVCDRRAEEGLNLQGSQAQLVHFDLPVSPNRVEQRIGRLDRYGTGQPVESCLFISKQSSYMMSLVDLHDSGFGVFERTISPLPYLVDKKLGELWPRVLSEGLPAIADATEALGGDDGEVAKELERVRAQDELDALEASQKSDDEFYDRLWDVDFDADRLEQVAHEWIRNRLQFHRVETDHGHERIFRYEYRTERTAKHPTLLPIRELLGRFAVAVDPEVAGFFSYPMSFHRGTACSQSVRVARIGEPFITAVQHYIRWDDRGTSFAMWRHVPRAELKRDPEVYFRFDFIVEADTTGAEEALAGMPQATEEAVRLRADGLFPPLIQTVWLGLDGERVDEETRDLLEMPYESDGTNRYGRDYNLNAERWETIEEMCERQWWADRCYEIREQASEVLAEEVGLDERCARYAERARRRAQQNIDRLQTRLDRFGDAAQGGQVAQLELEEALISALEAGIREPHIRLDSIGAIFLSTVDPYGEED